MKAELNQHNRIKRDENYEVLNSIKNRISQKIQAEFDAEIKDIKSENEKYWEEEKVFKEEARQILLKITPQTKLKVSTQVGRGSKIIQTYEGNLERKFEWRDGTFNFISPNNYDGKPFTIGFSCLQSIEIIN